MTTPHEHKLPVLIDVPFAKHNVSPDEVWDVCCDPLHLARKITDYRHLIYGQTASERYLFIVVQYETDIGYKPVTARDMTKSEIARRAHAQGISIETYVNLSLLKVIREPETRYGDKQQTPDR